MFNVGQFLHVMLVFVLSVEISFYCMICASIKARFIALHKYLRQRTESSETFKAAAAAAATMSSRRTMMMMATSKPNEKLEFVSSQFSNASNVIEVASRSGNDDDDAIAELKSISRIYDEVLGIVVQMNESFSLLLSISFGKSRLMRCSCNELKSPLLLDRSQSKELKDHKN